MAVDWAFHSCRIVSRLDGHLQLTKDWLTANAQDLMMQPGAGHLRIDGQRATVYLGRCRRHKNCEFQFRFSVRQSQDQPDMNLQVVEQKGGHAEALDVDLLRKFYAQKYALLGSTQVVLLKMSQDGVPLELRPTARALEGVAVRLKAKGRQMKRYAACFVDTLRVYVANPPAGVKIHLNYCKISEDETRVYFSSESISQEASRYMGTSDEVYLCLDSTFGTNVQNLVLGAVGPAGVVAQGHGCSMRFCPALFFLSDAEDTSAYREALKYLASQHSVIMDDDVPLLDRVSDMWMNGTGGGINAAEEEALAEVHRCLEHIKSNLKKESAKKDSGTGRRRLRDPELLQEILDQVMFAATLPSDGESNLVVDNLLKRMESPTDWDEPAMASYMRECILTVRDGLLAAHWQSGVQAVPPGFTTYLLNAQERAWRTVKGLLPRGFKSRDASEIVKEVCEVTKVWVERAKFAGMTRLKVIRQRRPGDTVRKVSSSNGSK